MNTVTDGKLSVEQEIEQILLLLREKEKVKLLEWKGWPSYPVVSPKTFTYHHPSDIRDWGINE